MLEPIPNPIRLKQIHLRNMLHLQKIQLTLSRQRQNRFDSPFSLLSSLGKISRVKYVTPVYLFVNSCFNYTFLMGDSVQFFENQNITEETAESIDERKEAIFDVCTSENRYTPLEIKNTADYENEYYLSLANSPSWVSLDSNYVKLPSKSVGRF